MTVENVKSLLDTKIYLCSMFTVYIRQLMHYVPNVIL